MAWFGTRFEQDPLFLLLHALSSPQKPLVRLAISLLSIFFETSKTTVVQYRFIFSHIGFTELSVASVREVADTCSLALSRIDWTLKTQ